jgi:uncharacterized protein (UPF0332 family)
MATYQSVGAADRIDVAPHVARARDSLRAATLLAEADLAADAASRAHQACVHAERALLATERRAPPDFRSVHRMCALHFLQNGEVDEEHLGAIERLAELRSRADDQPAATVSPDDARGAIATARRFADAVERLLARTGYLAS